MRNFIVFKKQMRCQFCGKKHDNRDEHREHVYYNHICKDKIFKCRRKKCDKTYKKYSEAYQHECGEHRKIPKEEQYMHEINIYIPHPTSHFPCFVKDLQMFRTSLVISAKSTSQLLGLWWSFFFHGKSDNSNFWLASLTTQILFW